MRSEADQLGYPLDGPRHLQRDGPVDRIRHPRVQVIEDERRSLDADQVRDRQPGFGHLLPQLLRPVQKGGERPVVQRRQHPGAVYVADQIERRRVLQVEPLPEHAVDPGRPPRDRRGEHRPARPHDPRALPQRIDPFGPVEQMVERPEQQHGVHAGAGQAGVPHVADRGADPRHPGRLRRELLDVQRHQVPVLDLVPERGQPQRVPSRPAADVRDHGGRRRKPAQHDLGGPGELEFPAPVAQPFPLHAPLVVRAHGAVVRLHATRLWHIFILPTTH